MTTRVSLHTLGCRLNHAETEALRHQLASEGYHIVPEDADADLCVVNTCTVTEHSDAKNRQLIRGLHRRNPHARIAVTGCYAQMQPHAIAALEGVGLVVGNEEKSNLPQWLRQLHAGSAATQLIHDKIKRQSFAVPLLAAPAPTEAAVGLPTRGQLKVQDGCDFMCSFCIIPFARGRSRYREFENLCAEARQQVQRGVRELVLTGVNVGTYDHDGRTLRHIVEFLNGLPELSRIRISSIEPTTVEPELFAWMADPQHKLVPFFHLPLQSGSNKILQLMKRRYTAEAYAAEVQEACAQVPDLCVGADVMVGFPMEGDVEFQETLALLASLPMTYLHVFPFSERQGTPAVRLPSKVTPDVKQERARQLRELGKRKRSAFQRQLVGQLRDVLFEAPKPDGTVGGYTDNYQRVVLTETPPHALRNQLLPVRLLHTRGDVLVGQVV